MQSKTYAFCSVDSIHVLLVGKLSQDLIQLLPQEVDISTSVLNCISTKMTNVWNNIKHQGFSFSPECPIFRPIMTRQQRRTLLKLNLKGKNHFGNFLARILKRIRKSVMNGSGIRVSSDLFHKFPWDWTRLQFRRGL